MTFDPKRPSLFPALTGEPEAPVLAEPSLFYAPPYERPLEDEFAWHLVKYLNPVTALGYQVKVATPCAHFWVDFVVEHGGRRIGFECGELEAEADDRHERLRAALLVGSGEVDVLYRFRGVDLVHRLHDCLLLAARWDPELFSPRGRLNLDTLASPETQAHRPLRGETVARVAYRTDEEEGAAEGEAFTWPAPEQPTLVVHRLSHDNPAAWVRDFDHALAHFGVSEERLSARWGKTG